MRKQFKDRRAVTGDDGPQAHTTDNVYFDHASTLQPPMPYHVPDPAQELSEAEQQGFRDTHEGTDDLVARNLLPYETGLRSWFRFHYYGAEQHNLLTRSWQRAIVVDRQSAVRKAQAQLEASAATIRDLTAHVDEIESAIMRRGNRLALAHARVPSRVSGWLLACSIAVGTALELAINSMAFEAVNLPAEHTIAFAAAMSVGLILISWVAGKTISVRHLLGMCVAVPTFVVLLVAFTGMTVALRMEMLTSEVEATGTVLGDTAAFWSVCGLGALTAVLPIGLFSYELLQSPLTTELRKTRSALQQVKQSLPECEAQLTEAHGREHNASMNLDELAEHTKLSQQMVRDIAEAKRATYRSTLARSRPDADFSTSIQEGLKHPLELDVPDDAPRTPHAPVTANGEPVTDPNTVNITRGA